MTLGSSGGRFAFTAAADQDLIDIWLHIAHANVAAADRVYEMLYDRVRFLGDFPRAGRERLEWSEGVFAYPVDRYIIIYRVSTHGIAVLRIVHGARDITRLLDEG